MLSLLSFMAESDLSAVVKALQTLDLFFFIMSLRTDIRLELLLSRPASLLEAFALCL